MSIVDRFKSFTTSLSVAARIDAILAATLCLGLIGILVVIALLIWGTLNATHDGSKAETRGGFGRFAVALAVGGSSAVLGVLFWLSYATYVDASVAPADTYDIQLLSEHGVLSFTYPSGKVSKDKLVVPAGRPVRLILSSKDVPRGIAIPRLRLQQLAIPGRFTMLWFQLPQPALLSLRCTEGCAMSPAKEPVLQSLTDTQFDAWLSNGTRAVALNAEAK